jgi:type I restriction enzyme R subunit
MLYEIISPNKFLQPFIDNYTTLSAIYDVVRNAYSKKVYVDRAFQKKTNELVQKHIGAEQLGQVLEFVKIDETSSPKDCNEPESVVESFRRFDRA